MSSFALSACLRRVMVAACLVLLGACGGGGGGSAVMSSRSTEQSTSTSSAPAPSSDVAGLCTLAGEQAFARSHLNEVYLWSDRIPEVDPTAHTTLASYFDALVLRSPDANGRPVDRFSSVLSSADADALLSSSSQPLAGLVAAPTTAVPIVSTLTTGGHRQVGYLLFNRHGRGAQDALITAFQALRDHQVRDLVLDLRHNPGGYLYIAQAAASMIAGPRQDGQVFEQLRYNQRLSAQGAGMTLRFGSTVQRAESVYPVGHPLPQLDLPRVYVLATGLTCSASESIVNGLRGVGIEVVLVGDTTCGKPYGFQRKDNCGTAYFAIQFQGVNAQGFGDYATGFTPTCPVAEDPWAPLGDAREPLLAAALHHIDTGACPAAKGGGRTMGKRQDAAAGLLGRLLAP
ncbi:hypothetical protein JI739_15390 [Ramlibacter sp. AW1]|uniref:Tail specific protease domain-containing protein n=1 Tax=Ramlibacter aurantiacus TaxID=2801330 RepID=A0A937D780_9BURK|nr:S41 family peptidase [Ramlibacter aurantiacus]MBL0421733.1 hypothetical protein [Ramlibacter aurantiacus]